MLRRFLSATLLLCAATAAPAQSPLHVGVVYDATTSWYWVHVEYDFSSDDPDSLNAVYNAYASNTHDVEFATLTRAHNTWDYPLPFCCTSLDVTVGNYVVALEGNPYLN